MSTQPAELQDKIVCSFLFFMTPSKAARSSWHAQPLQRLLFPLPRHCWALIKITLKSHQGALEFAVLFSSNHIFNHNYRIFFSFLRWGLIMLPRLASNFEFR
jgi:hypothetical protein